MPTRTQSVILTVPEGGKPGDTLYVHVRDGVPAAQFKLPDGVAPGESIRVNVRYSFAKKPKKRDLLIDFMAGVVSGAISKTITAPIDYFKLVSQSQGCGFAMDVSGYSYLDMWAGNTINILRYFPIQMFNLTFRDSIKGYFPTNSKAHQLCTSLLAGASSLVVVYPFDVLRTRMAVATVCPAVVGSVYTSYLPNGHQVGLLRHQIHSMLLLCSGGPDLTGFCTSVAGIIAYRAAQFGLNDTGMALNPWAKEFGIKAVFSKFLVAQVAITLSGLVAYPFDTVRRALQLQSCLPPTEWNFSGAFSCARYIAESQGFLGLWSGAKKNILRGIVASIVLVLYGEISLAMARQEKDDDAIEGNKEKDE